MHAFKWIVRIVIVLVVLAVGLFGFMVWYQKQPAPVNGFCCMTPGSACTASATSYACFQQQGHFFFPKQDTCDQLCKNAATQ